MKKHNTAFFLFFLFMMNSCSAIKFINASDLYPLKDPEEWGEIAQLKIEKTIGYGNLTQNHLIKVKRFTNAIFVSSSISTYLDNGLTYETEYGQSVQYNGYEAVYKISFLDASLEPDSQLVEEIYKNVMTESDYYTFLASHSLNDYTNEFYETTEEVFDLMKSLSAQQILNLEALYEVEFSQSVDTFKLALTNEVQERSFYALTINNNIPVKLIVGESKKEDVNEWHLIHYTPVYRDTLVGKTYQ